MDYLFYGLLAGDLLLNLFLIALLFVLGRWLRDQYDSTALLWLAAALVLGLGIGFLAPTLTKHAVDAAVQRGHTKIGQVAATLGYAGSFVRECGMTLLYVMVIGDSIRLLRRLMPSKSLPLGFLAAAVDHRKVLGLSALVLVSLAPLVGPVYLEIFP